MAVGQRMSEDAYQRFVLSTMEARWELHDGVLVEKPGRAWEHGSIVSDLGFLLQDQLDRADYRVFVGLRVRHPPATIYVPDVTVVPTRYGDEFRGRSDVVAIFAAPLPLVVEVWSAIGDYDVDAKLPVYQQRGALEIWRIHPYERTLTAWRRLPDGSYEESGYREGVVRPAALPDVAIDLAMLFDG